MYECVVALYENTEKQLCIVSYHPEMNMIEVASLDSYIVEENWEDAFKYMANDFIKFIKLNRDLFPIEQQQADKLDEVCNCSHKFIDELNRFGFELTYERGEEKLWKS